MHQLRGTLSVLSFLLLVLAGALSQAQQPRFLNIKPPSGLPIVPIMEGWIVNPDGTRSYSYGYLNRNDEAVEIPLSESNFIEPAEFLSLIHI